MVRRRKQDYTGKVMQQEHGQAVKPTQAETVGEAGMSEADHIGKQNSGMVFSLFPQLPYELRLLVWEAALTPRLVAVIPRPCTKNRDETRYRTDREISLLRGMPALLAVNKEARHVALRYYTWRFTVDVIIDNDDSWNSNHRQRRAHVVMSPDDTLGLFRCEQGWKANACITNFDVKIANDKKSPWRNHETTSAPENGFKKVAILGDAIESDLHIVRALNATLWDLDSILHPESAGMRTARSPHIKHRILLESAKMNQKFLELMAALPNSRQLLMDWNGQSLDILTFQLAEGEEGADDWIDFLDLLSRPRLSR